jgi:hypothetical protein
MSGGYVFCYGSCVNCERPISFHPHKVPSIRLNGQREPLCVQCFNKWNHVQRVSKGLAPVSLDPEAYGPAREEEL